MAIQNHDHEEVSSMRRVLRSSIILLFAAGVVPFLFAGGAKEVQHKGPVTIALLVKNLGNPFFDAADKGAEEAAAELGNTKVIYQGPSTPTAEGQISIIESLIAQKVDGIAISANDSNALVPIDQRAMKAGIKVISFDSGVAPAGRILHVAASNDELIGRTEVQIISKLIGGSGEIAILSASPTATNQNTWIDWMKKELALPQYANIKLDTIVYGNDLPDQSYREAMGLFKSYPNLKGIISPTSVGIAALGKALEDAKLAGKIQMTGLGLPSQMKQYITDGTCQEMELWNPIDLGYAAVYITHGLVTGQFTGKPGEVMKVGRLGDITVGADGTAVMGKPFVFDKSNIDKYAALF
jgi:rhamnose transport system substrate-binding protein